MKTKVVIIVTALIGLISAIKTDEQQTNVTGFIENSTNITTLRNDADPDSYNITTLNAPGRPKEKLPLQLYLGEEGEEEKELEVEKTKEEEKKMKNEKEEKAEEKKVKNEKEEERKVVGGEGEEEGTVKRVGKREKENELKNEAESVDNGRGKKDKQGKNEAKNEQHNRNTFESEESNFEEETEDADDDAQEQDLANLENESADYVSDYQSDYVMSDDDYRDRRESRGLEHLSHQAQLFRAINVDRTFEDWSVGRENEIEDMIRVLGQNSDLPYKDEHFRPPERTTPPNKSDQNKNAKRSFHDRNVFEYTSDDYYFDQSEDDFPLHHNQDGDDIK